MSSHDARLQDASYGFGSRDYAILCNGEPGDTSVRLARSLLLRLALAEQERMGRWLGDLDQQSTTRVVAQ